MGGRGPVAASGVGNARARRFQRSTEWMVEGGHLPGHLHGHLHGHPPTVRLAANQERIGNSVEGQAVFGTGEAVALVRIEDVGDVGDEDVLGLHCCDNLIAFGLLHTRDGRYLADEHFIWELGADSVHADGDAVDGGQVAGFPADYIRGDVEDVGVRVGPEVETHAGYGGGGVGSLTGATHTLRTPFTGAT